jgi:Fe-S cluster biosynthesis and repair protein YggX
LEAAGGPVTHHKYVPTEQGKFIYKKLLAVNMTREQFWVEFRENLERFVKHKRLCLLDTHDRKLLEESYDEKSIVIKRDFMANYSAAGPYTLTCTIPKQVTSLCAAVSSDRREHDDRLLQKKSHFFFIAEKREDEIAANWQYDNVAVKHMWQKAQSTNPALEKLYLISDQCGSQFKCKQAAYSMSLLANELQIRWLHVFFSETGNGKGENDGQGFWLKNQWHNKERMRSRRMDDAFDCFEGTEDFEKQPSDPASDEPRPYGTVHRREFVFLVDKSQQQDDKFNDKDVIFTDFARNKIDCTPVLGIQSTHEWLFSCDWSDGTLRTRRRHCACPSCRDHDYGPQTDCQNKSEM